MRAQTPRTAAVVIATVTSAMTIGAGLAMTVVDEQSFPTLGAGMWWAVQTVTTVGYGDEVPGDTWGRLLAAAVMLLGIGFVTVITAAITSAFIARNNRELGVEDETAAQLKRIEEQLARIEQALASRS